MKIAQYLLKFFTSLSLLQQVFVGLFVPFVIYVCKKVFSKKAPSEDKKAPAPTTTIGDGNIVNSPNSSSTVTKK